MKTLFNLRATVGSAKEMHGTKERFLFNGKEDFDVESRNTEDNWPYDSVVRRSQDEATSGAAGNVVSKNAAADDNRFGDSLFWNLNGDDDGDRSDTVDPISPFVKKTIKTKNGLFFKCFFEQVTYHLNKNPMDENFYPF